MSDSKSDTSMLSMLIFLYSFLNSFTLTFIASTYNHTAQASPDVGSHLSDMHY